MEILFYIVIAFGLVVVLQLRGISRRLDDNYSAMQDLKTELEEMGEKIDEESQWFKTGTFAHDVKEWLEQIPKDIVEELREIPKDIVDELQWHRAGTFAHQIREWIESAAVDVRNDLTTVENSLSSIETTLSNIESNTSA